MVNHPNRSRGGGLPHLPALNEAELVRGARPYAGPLEPGDVFAWEPDLPHARKLCVITRIGPAPPPQIIPHSRGVAHLGFPTENVVWTRRFPDGHEECWNEEDHFRKAVVETRFRRAQP